MAEKEQKWDEDEFGVVTWRGYGQGDTWHTNGHEPFTKTLNILNSARIRDQAGTVAAVADAAIHVHDDLEVARSIAVSLFGKFWREHIMDVYDRMQAEMARQGGEADASPEAHPS